MSNPQQQRYGKDKIVPLSPPARCAILHSCFTHPVVLLVGTCRRSLNFHSRRAAKILSTTPW
jgi:hypothetical protein